MRTLTKIKLPKGKLVKETMEILESSCFLKIPSWHYMILNKFETALTSTS